MYKKVAFITKEDKPERFDIVETVLTEGYAQGGIFDLESVGDDGKFTFLVNRCDLADLRHDVSVLVKAGFSVREVEL